MSNPVQSSLAVMVPLKPEASGPLREGLKDGLVGPAALDAIGTVHFARIFVMEENNPAGISPDLACVITSYDGDFDTYIQDFVNRVGDFFDVLLKASSDPDAAGLIPVKQNAAAFTAFVKKYDVTNSANTWGFWYSAYPKLTVKMIKNMTP